MCRIALPGRRSSSEDSGNGEKYHSNKILVADTVPPNVEGDVPISRPLSYHLEDSDMKSDRKNHMKYVKCKLSKFYLFQ